MTTRDIIVEIESINKRVDEIAKEFMSREDSRERRIYQENDWDFGQYKNPHSSFHIPQDHLLLDEDFENYERSQRSNLSAVWSWLKLHIKFLYILLYINIYIYIYIIIIILYIIIIIYNII